MMRTTMKMTVASVLLIALFAVGCGAAQKATQERSSLDPKTTQGTSGQGTASEPSTSPNPKPTIPQPTLNPPPPAQWELLGKWNDVQGTIVGMQLVNDKVSTLQLLVEKDFKTPTSSDTTPDFPFRVGSTVEIAVDSTTSGGDVMHPKVWDDIVLSVGQFGNSKDEKAAPFWGSSLDRYWYEKDHKFYNTKGDVYKIFTGPDLQQTQVYTQ